MSLQTRIEAMAAADEFITRAQSCCPRLPAVVNYIRRSQSKPTIVMDAGGVRGRSGEPARDARIVTVTDLRGKTDLHTLDESGFAFIKQGTAVRDFRDSAQIRQIYEHEVESLLRRITGAIEVRIFDHMIRVEDPSGDDRLPVRHVHADYTERSGHARLSDVLGVAAAKRWSGERFAFVNVWRSINGPVEQSPLAFIDARTVAPSDLVATDLVYRDRIAEIYEVAYNPDHSWMYLSGMDATDAVVFTSFDSRRDGLVRIAPQTTIDVPPPDSDRSNAVRHGRSIETRAVIRFAR